eukprot:m.223471 g.223471  ORF g.223471 m.223471 type:complete len:151 (-) comp18754_c2_seq5:275-727(-)
MSTDAELERMRAHHARKRELHSQRFHSRTQKERDLLGRLQQQLISMQHQPSELPTKRRASSKAPAKKKSGAGGGRKIKGTDTLQDQHLAQGQHPRRGAAQAKLETDDLAIGVVERKNKRIMPPGPPRNHPLLCNTLETPTHTPVCLVKSQ